jgi:hypothetical protein
MTSRAPSLCTTSGTAWRPVFFGSRTTFRAIGQPPRTDGSNTGKADLVGISCVAGDRSGMSPHVAAWAASSGTSAAFPVDRLFKAT